MSSRRTLRSATLLATIAFALTACGPLASDSEPAATDAPIEQQPADAVTEASAAQDAAEGSAEPADVVAEETATVEPAAVESDAVEPISTDAVSTDAVSTEPVSTDAVSTEPAPAPAPVVAEHRRCTVPQGADGLDYIVDGIRHDDPDGGLTGRINAGYSYDAVGLLPEGTIVGSYADEAGFPSCLMTRDGGIWWEVYSSDLSTTIWVNSQYLIEYNGPVPGYPEDEADVHTDCVYLPDLPDTCIVVYTSGGVIMGADITEEETYELMYACVFQDVAQACDVLATIHVEGTDIDEEMRLGPLESYEAGCYEGTGAFQKLSCAEVDRRL